MVVLGSIYTGISTPTEAAGVGATIALFVGALYRKLTWRNVYTALRNTATVSGFIFIIIVTAMFFGYYLTITGATQLMTSAALATGFHPNTIMMLIFLVLTVLGFFLSPAAVLFIATPILLPVVSALGFDLVWFGVVMVVAIELGLITPPVGTNLFAIRGIAPDVPMGDIILGAVPFMVENIITLFLLLFFPAIALWLPATMMR